MISEALAKEIESKKFEPGKKAAIYSYKEPGTYLIIAGAGTGKTTAITYRVKAILDDKELGTTADRILCITFTDAAAKEMKKKFLEKGVPNALSINVFTYHSFCMNLMKQYPELFDMKNKKEIMPIQKQAIVKECIDELKDELEYLCTYNEIDNITKGIEAIKHNRLYNVETRECDFKDNIKNNDAWQAIEETSQKIAKVNELSKIYNVYKDKTSDYIDFDDMINLVLEQFEKNPEFLKEVASQYDFVMVDEYQDTNKTQNDIVFKLAENCKNTFVVGDDDQIIYTFQGASLTTIEKFLEKFKDTKVKVFTHNFRSTDNILRVSEQLANIQDEYVEYYIEKNINGGGGKKRAENIKEKFKNKIFPLRLISKDNFTKYWKDENGNQIEHPKQLESKEETLQTSDKNTPVILQEYESDEKEKYNIVQKIQKIIKNNNMENKLSEIAVLTKTNAEAEEYASLLKEYGIKVQLVKGKNIFHSNSVNLLLAYIRFFTDKSADKLYSFMLSKPFHIHPDDYALLQHKEMKKGDILQTIKNAIQKSDIAKSVKNEIYKIEKIINENNLKENKENEENIFKNIVSILTNELKTFETDDKKQQLEKLIDELNKKGEISEQLDKTEKYFKENLERFILKGIYKDGKYKGKYTLQKLLDDYEVLNTYAQGESLKNIIHQAACVTGILQSYISLEINRTENILAIKKLEDVAEEFLSLKKNANLQDFINYIDAIIDADTEIYTDTEMKPNAVQISTLHSSKGREFEYVFMPNLIPDKYETSKESVKEVVPLPKQNINAIEDEIYDKLKVAQRVEDKEKQTKFLNCLKLLYVGMTRAKHKLELSYSGSPSYFIEKIKNKKANLKYLEIPEQIIELPDLYEKDNYDTRLSEAIEDIEQYGKPINDESKEKYNNALQIIKELKDKMTYTIMPDSEMKYDYKYSEEFKAYIDNNIPEVHSPSSLNVYIKCHKQYFYKYILKLRPYKIQIEDSKTNTDEYSLEYGTAIHYALECMVNYVKEKGSYPNQEYLCEKFTEKAEEILSNPDTSKMEENKKYLKLYLEDIRDNVPENNIESAEYKIKDLKTGNDYVEIDGVKIKGTIDRLDKIDDETYNIIDYKTGREAKDIKEFKATGKHWNYYNQVAIYRYILEEYLKMKINKVEIIQPQYPEQETELKLLEGTAGFENCKKVKDRYVQMANEIKKHNFECETVKEQKDGNIKIQKPDEFYTCRYCDYNGFCKSKVI